MFAEFVFASLIAAGGTAALDAGPELTPAVVRQADASESASGHVRMAADLGCPRSYDRRRGYDKRCHHRNARRGHNRPREGYGRYDDPYGTRNPGRYSDRGGPYYDDPGYRSDLEPRRDTLRDRFGRPYSDAEPGLDADVPHYRRGAYDEPAPRDSRFDRRDYYEAPEPRRRGDDYRPYREGRALDRDAADYQSASYREPLYKKKDTGGMTATTNQSRSAVSAAGSTV